MRKGFRSQNRAVIYEKKAQNKMNNNYSGKKILLKKNRRLEPLHHALHHAQIVLEIIL